MKVVGGLTMDQYLANINGSSSKEVKPPVQVTNKVVHRVTLPAKESKDEKKRTKKKASTFKRKPLKEGEIEVELKGYKHYKQRLADALAGKNLDPEKDKILRRGPRAKSDLEKQIESVRKSGGTVEFIKPGGMGMHQKIQDAMKKKEEELASRESKFKIDADKYTNDMREYQANLQNHYGF